MALPKAIQAQLDQAEAIQAQINGDVTENSETHQPEEQHHEPAANEPAIQPAPVATEPVQHQQNTPQQETWERKYHTLQGMYNADVPRLHQQVRDMGQTLQQLIAENAQLKAEHAKPQAVQQPAQVPLITDSDKEAFGSDLIDLADRIAKQNLAQYEAERKQMVSELNELRKQVGDVEQQVTVSAKDKFFVDLARGVPDWEAINVDQEFLNWLNEVDPIYGISRQAGLDKAFQALDASRMTNIFNAFKAASGRNKPQQTSSAQQQLQNQVAPTRSRLNPAPAATSEVGRIWTQKQIQQFYNERRRGFMDDAQAARIEAEIDQAVAEGRVSL